jgi:hypothetical protein
VIPQVEDPGDGFVRPLVWELRDDFTVHTFRVLTEHVNSLEVSHDEDLRGQV